MGEKDPQMTSTDIAKTPLVYNGEIISTKAEAVSLTDMWRAAGSPEGKRPSNWGRKEGADFIAFVAETLNVPVRHILKAERGKGGQTLGHWQIALAYAKCLSGDFHMWCNTVVRERMEGRAATVPAIPPELVEKIERSFGISCMVSHKVTEIEKALPAMLATLTAIAGIVQPGHPILMRHGRTAGEIWRMNHFPPIRVTSWFSNRLVAMGCEIEGKGRAEVGGRTYKLFDPDKAANWLNNGGRALVQEYIARRRGQTTLRLVSRSTVVEVANSPAGAA